MTNNIIPGNVKLAIGFPNWSLLSNLWPRLGLRYCVCRQLPFRFPSLWRALSIPSLTPAFPLNSIHYVTHLQLSSSVSPSSFDPSPWVTNILLRTSFFLSCAPPTRLPLTLFITHLLEGTPSVPQSHFLASLSCLNCLLIYNNRATTSLKPSRGFSEKVYMMPGTKWELISPPLLEAFFSPGSHSAPYSFPWVRGFVFTSVCHLLRDFIGPLEPVVTSMQRSRWNLSSRFRLEVSPVNQQVPSQTHHQWPPWSPVLTNGFCLPPLASFLYLSLGNHQKLLYLPITNHLWSSVLFYTTHNALIKPFLITMKLLYPWLLVLTTLVVTSSRDSCLTNLPLLLIILQTTSEGFS